MSAFDILWLSVALAMDCFTVSMVSGVMLRRGVSGAILRMAILFGLFQAAMPLAGWLAMAGFRQYIEAVDHWIAFGLLLFVGGKMMYDAAGDDAGASFNPLLLRTQLTLAVATSIDALAVGISIACMGYGHITQLAMPLLAIGMASLLLSLSGYWVGVCFGQVIARRLKPGLFGGIVLIAIGIKVLLSHLYM